YVDLFRTLGANPTPMSFGELYTALQQGTVDGQENPPPLIYASKFYEVQKHLSLTGHTWNFNVIAISKAFFDSLPEEFRTIVVEGARTQIVEQERAIEAQIQEEYIEKLKQEGMIVNDIIPENRQRFIETTQPVRDKHLKGFSEELLSAMAEANR
ncbi:MAG: TRAP transporter substrate-binding protein, partial [Dehalococcoidales bacterium]|nr:TRAP transporter substrate-binding protein [Dehalococcoidales bacterium]